MLRIVYALFNIILSVRKRLFIDHWSVLIDTRKKGEMRNVFHLFLEYKYGEPKNSVNIKKYDQT